MLIPNKTIINSINKWKSGLDTCVLSVVCVYGQDRQHRHISTTAQMYGKRNFRKFTIPNRRSQFEPNKMPKHLIESDYDYPLFRDTLLVRYPGIWFKRKFIHVPEMEPQLIVPDLDGFELKPYVSYRCPDIKQSEFTARDLFNATLADSIIEKFKNNQEMNLSVDENEIEMARIRAKQTGADLFIENSDFGIKR